MSQGKDQGRTAWALVDDLILRSKVDALARDAEFATRSFGTPESLVAALDDASVPRPALVIIDVSDRGGKGLALLGQLAAARDAAPAGAAGAPVPTLAFYAHTSIDVRREAEALGVNRIVPRSAFVLRFAEIARELAG